MTRKNYTDPMTSQVISRLAPTPSGHLHLGNVFNFILTWWYVRSHQGTLHLRIDDFDAERSKPRWIEHIFSSLNELEITWDKGPFGVEEFKRDYSQQNKKELYRSKVDSISKQLFICDCSNSSWKKKGFLGYQGQCLDLKKEEEPYKTKLRLNYQNAKLSPDLQFPILWRKDNQPSYHLVSVIDDSLMQTNVIIRGEDLYGASLFQKDLSSMMSLSFSEDIYHHALVKNSKGEKLSKSQTSPAFSSKDKTYKAFCDWLEISPISSLKDLLEIPFPLEVFSNPGSDRL